MNVEETKQILRKLRVNYPNSYQKLSDEDTFELVDLWHLSFKDIPAETVAAAVFTAYHPSKEGFFAGVSAFSCILARDMRKYTHEYRTSGARGES